MSGLFGSGNKVAKSAPEASSLRVTTACYGRPIPIGWGRYKVAGFVLWYGDFKAIAHEQSQGGKGGDSYTSVNYTYEAAVVVGFGEGPINDVMAAWKDKEYYGAVTSSSKTYRKTEIVRVPFTGIVTLNPPATITAVLGVGVPWTFNRDMAGAVFTNPTDYTRSGNTLTFTNSSAFGINVNVTYEYTVTANDNPMTKIGLSLLKGTYPQTVWSYLTTNHASEAIPYSGIVIGVAPSYQLGASPAFPNTSVEIDSGFGYSNTIRDVNPGDFVPDFLCNPFYGAYFPSDLLGDLSDYSTYCIASGLFLSPDYTEQTPAAETLARIAAITNSDWTLADGKLKLVPYADQAVTGNGKTWTPNLTAQYALGPDDFVSAPGEEPITVRRKDPSERYNYLRVKFRSRDTQYNDDVAEGKDEAEIGRNGLRPAPYDQEVPEVKVRATAKTIADLLVQRTVNVCNTYEFTLKRNKVGLEPMDLLTLTHADYQLSGQLVRIIEIDEQDNGDLRVVAEEVPFGTASSVAYPTETPSGYAANYNVSPGNAEAPVVFELPDDVTGYPLSIGVAATGLGADWGGCEVWVSADGTTYEQWGEIRGGSRYGALTTAISTSVGVLLKSGQLLSASTAGAAARATLCYVGGANPEFFAYRDATLTGALAYTLSTLTRGLYALGGTSAHAGGDVFVRVDDSVTLSGAIDPAMKGKTLYVKLLSFNKYGGGKQTLADVSAYTYTVHGLFIRASLRANNYDFTEGMEGWVGISSVATGDVGSSAGTYGVHGAGIGGIAYPRKVPVDPSRRYRVTGRLWADAGGGGPVYVGVVPFDINGNVISNSGGATYPYCASIGLPLAGPGWRVFSGEISGTQPVPATGYQKNKFPVGTVAAAPMCFPYTGFVGPLLIDYLTLEDITDAVASADAGFSVYRLWDFNTGTLEGWTTNQLTVTYPNQTQIEVQSTGVDPILLSPALSFHGSMYFKVRLRIQRTAGSSWQGTLYWTTSAHGESGTYCMIIPAEEQPTSDWKILEFDIGRHGVSDTAKADWAANEIKTIRLDLATGVAGDAFLIDWIAIGKPAAPTDLTVVTNSQWVSRGVSINGDSAVKVLQNTGWDADVYSREQYYGGAVASASFDVSTTRACMFGLNSDPLTDANYTSLDFAFYYNGSQIEIYESGAGRGVYVASPQPGDVYTVAYDGSQVYYLRNGTLLRSIPANPGQAFFFDSSFLNINATLTGMRFGPMTSNNWASIGGAAKPSDYASADLTLVNSGNCTQQGNRATKTGGTNAWDGGMHSRDGYLGGASVSIYVHNSQTESSKEAMFGLNNVPSTASYTDINFAYYMLGAGGGVGNLYVYLEGSVGNGGASIGTFSDNDHLAITYDGYKARWYKNGVVLYELTSIDTTSRWYFDCAIAQVGEYYDRISFRPMSMVAGIAPTQLANDIQSDNFVAGSSGWRIRRSDGTAEFGAASIRGVLAAANILGSASITSRISQALTLTGGAVQSFRVSSPSALTVEVQTSTNIANTEVEFVGDFNFLLNASFAGGGGTYRTEIIARIEYEFWNGSSWVGSATDNDVRFIHPVTLTGSEIIRVPYHLKERSTVNTNLYSQFRASIWVTFAGFRQLVVNGSGIKTDCLNTATLEGKFIMKQDPN